MRALRRGRPDRGAVAAPDSPATGSVADALQTTPPPAIPCQAYCLNFGGRVTQASIKNFQLATPENQAGPCWAGNPPRLASMGTHGVRGAPNLTA